MVLKLESLFLILLYATEFKNIEKTTLQVFGMKILKTFQ